MPFCGGLVKVNYVGSGMYCNAYKFSFLNIRGKKIFDDVILKTYKTPAEIIKHRSIQEFLPKKIFSSMSDSELKLYLENLYKGQGKTGDELKVLVSNEFAKIRKSTKEET